MGMAYSAVFTAVAVSAAQDLFEIVAPADACVEIISCRIGQSSDAGDAQAEMLRVDYIKGFTASGSGGSAPTPAPLETGFAAAGSTVEANNTTLANTGATTTPYSDTFNVQVGHQYVPVPEERIILSPGQRLVIRLPAAPADLLTLSGTVVFNEIGG